MVMYPAELAGNESASAEPDQAPVPAQFSLLVAKHVLFDVRQTDPHEAIEALVNHYLSQHGMSSPEKAWLLAEALSQSSLEITKGIALLHVHYDEIDQPVLLLGVCPAGLTVRGVSSSVTGVFLLLSPATHPPEEHLHTLSEVARMVLAAPHLDRLAQATTYADLRALFGLDAEAPPAETSV
jgi:mannitol/fructose-specific phosphotransferase system IIA component (Ntr-type)